MNNLRNFLSGCIFLTSIATSAMYTGSLHKKQEEKRMDSAFTNEEVSKPQVPSAIALLKRTGQSPLHQAVLSNDLEKLKQLFPTGTHCPQDVYGITPLHEAAYIGNKTMVILLVNRGACPNDQDMWGMVPLSYAIVAGHDAIVRFLVNKGASIFQVGSFSMSPYELAQAMNSQSCKDILQVKANQGNEEEFVSHPPLHRAAMVNDTARVAALLESGAACDEVNFRNATALHVAAVWGCNDIVALFVEYGADVDSVDVDGKTPLHYACMVGYKNVVRELINSGASLIIKDSSGKTSYDYAHEAGHKFIAKLLLKNCYEQPIETNEAIENSENEEAPGALRYIIEQLYREDRVGVTKAHRAVQHYKGESLEELTNASKPDTNKALLTIEDFLKRDERGITPLHEAAYRGHKKFIEQLISSDGFRFAGYSLHHALINPLIYVEDYYGLRPLHCAVAGGHIDCVKALIEAHASADVIDCCYVIGPLDLAIILGEKDIEEYLRAHSAHEATSTKDIFRVALIGGSLTRVKNMLASEDQESLQHFWPPSLVFASFWGHRNLTQYLLERATFSSLDKEWAHKEWALSVAAANGHYEVVKDLLNVGAQPNCRDAVDKINTEMTRLVKYYRVIYPESLQLKMPLTGAICGGFKKIVEMLVNSGARISEQDVEEAARCCNAPMLDFLLGRGIALSSAAQKRIDNAASESSGHVEVISVLLKHGFSGPHFLHEAVYNGRIDLIKSCLKQGANVNEPLVDHDSTAIFERLSNFGSLYSETPLAVAVRQKNQEIAELLLFYNADVTAESVVVALLSLVGLEGTAPFIQFFLDHGAPVNTLYYNLNSHIHQNLFHASCYYGIPELVRSCVDHGANRQLPDSKGFTGLAIAKHFAESTGDGLASGKYQEVYTYLQSLEPADTKKKKIFSFLKKR